MTTLIQAALALSKILQNTVEGTATGGSATTVVDTARYEPADFFDTGTIWILSGNNSGKKAQITDWNLGTFTFTFPTMTLLNAAGNLYAAAPNDYPYWLLAQKINETHRKLMEISENTALTTVSEQQEYTLPAGVYNVKRVEVAQFGSAPYYWQRHHNWVERNGKLVFDDGCAPILDGYGIRLLYSVPPADLTDASAISDTIILDRLIWNAAVECLRWKLGLIRSDDKEKQRQYQDALVMAQHQAAIFPIEEMPRDPRHAPW